MAFLDEITGPLGNKKAAHLLRRATFGPNMAQIKDFATKTAAEAMDEIFDTDELKNPLPTPPIDLATMLPWVNPPWIDPPGIYKASAGNSEQPDLIGYFKAWHLDVMRQSGVYIREKLTWFLHTHLPVSIGVVESSESLFYQNCFFRHYALGSFKELFKKICIDNAMLRYIDGYTNHKDSPNENFAREMLELYSIGRGEQIGDGDYTTYTEDDVKAATRVLTGWELDENYETLDIDTGIPIGKMRTSNSGVPDKYIASGHDGGTKTFSEKFDDQAITTPPEEMINGKPTTDGAAIELDEMIEMVFAKKQTAVYLATKLYRFFVYHIISEDAVNEMADILYANNYVLADALKVLFKSNHFFDADANTADDIHGALIKSPLDLTLGLMNFFHVAIPDRDSDTENFYKDMGYLVENIYEQGLDFYEPYDVAGYDAYHQVPGFSRNWITTYSLVYRYRVGKMLMRDAGGLENYDFSLNILAWVEDPNNVADPGNSEELVSAIIDNLFALELTTERFEYFLNTIFLRDLPAGTWTGYWNEYVSTKDETDVLENYLRPFIIELTQSPELQLS